MTWNQLLLRVCTTWIPQHPRREQQHTIARHLLQQKSQPFNSMTRFVAHASCSGMDPEATGQQKLQHGHCTVSQSATSIATSTNDSFKQNGMDPVNRLSSTRTSSKNVQ